MKSLQGQTFTDFEAIMVDDGSADGSGSICRSYAACDKRFHYIRQENSGVSATRNRGIREATAEYITFLDSDDWYSDDYLQKFYALIHEDPSCGHFWCGYEVISDRPEDNGQIVRTDRQETVADLDRSEIMTLHDQMLLAPVWNKVFRRDVIAEFDLRMPEDLSLGEDLLFNFAYLDHCKDTRIRMLNEGIYKYYAVSVGSLNKKYRSDLRDIYIRLSEEIYRYLSRWPLKPDQMERYYRAVRHMLVRAMENTFSPMNNMSSRGKLSYNNQIMRSKLFQEAVEQTKSSIHPLRRAAFWLGDYRAVQLVERVSAKKNHIFKKGR